MASTRSAQKADVTFIQSRVELTSVMDVVKPDVCDSVDCRDPRAERPENLSPLCKGSHVCYVM
jgi:hypothetical protein